MRTNTATDSPSSSWGILLFALLIFGGGLAAMVTSTSDTSAPAITTLATAVLGVVGTHVGHMAGSELAIKKANSDPPLVAAIERLAILNTEGKLTKEEFDTAKEKLLS